MAAYCAPADLYANGLPRGAVANPGRLAASALAATNAFTLDVHGFDAGDPVALRAEAGGALPAPLAEGVTYYAAPLSESTFALSATPGGAALDLTTDGVRVVVIAPLPVAQAIEWASRIVDDMLPAHVVPLEAPYPEIVVMTTAELAAGKLVARSGGASVSLSSIVDAATARVARWAKGVPVRGDHSPPRAGLAARASIPYSDPTDWNRFGGL